MFDLDDLARFPWQYNPFSCLVVPQRGMKGSPVIAGIAVSFAVNLTHRRGCSVLGGGLSEVHLMLVHLKQGKALSFLQHVPSDCL